MKKVLVLGASGYIGSQLLPILASRGYKVTGAARQLEYLKARVEPAPNLSLVYLDLADAEETQGLIAQHDIVFFLVHGMAHGYDFVDYELSLAVNVKNALNHSNVEHVIYLSAIQPQTADSEHLKARRETGAILRQSKVPITELRAGVIIGPGSAAYEIMRDFVMNLPMLVTPTSVDSKANPIALENLNFYLMSVVQEHPQESVIYEVGGPHSLTYREQFQIICEANQRPFKIWTTPMLTPRLASQWLGTVTSVPAAVGRALLAGLEHDFVANDQVIKAKYPQDLIPFQQAVEQSISQDGEFLRSNVWGYDPTALKRWQPGYGYYPKQAGATFKTSASLASLWNIAKQLGSRKEGYFFANPLWRLREWLDILFGGGRPIRREPDGPELKVGDHIDSWKVIRVEAPKFLSLLFGMKGPGLGRLEVQLEDFGEERQISITAWWHPKGFAGLLYWFAMMPAHLFIFRGMVRAIAKKAMALDTQ
ncbi:DUF2867 domain-containing protein [Vibrio astriarenae]|uniref:DUF2867 domain-containing protein n=1 Tax=Vibrio astriarenae TaxID=1481923 RepID=A0A7Z2T2Y9_9VIBR|nr:DUF2867 domain-containing protein [Vibrio astriarenae]QIA63429.1 DUF2867 domain-containing protein [Vibrio astriarenae]